MLILIMLTDDQRIFLKACLQGKFKLVKRMYNYRNINSEICTPSTLKKLCKQGCYLEIIRWMWLKVSLDIDKTIKLFEYACLSGNIATIEWIWSNKLTSSQYDIDRRITKIFNKVCGHGDCITLQWMIDRVMNISICSKSLYMVFTHNKIYIINCNYFT